MISNLRARPIEGHVADSAGNILRNAQITIKQTTPTGNYTIDLINSDDNGYFVTSPLPSGVYDVYESGTHVSRMIHEAVSSSIQCFKASTDNYDTDLIENFDTLAAAGTLNNYKALIQIEPIFMNVYQYGNMFPIYDLNIAQDPTNNDNSEIYNIANFFKFSQYSRITTTRYDVEYFSPITPTSTLYKRVRWAGVPAIRFYKDSRLLIPLDYYSIVPSLPKSTIPANNSLTVTNITATVLTTTTFSIGQPVDGELLDLSRLISKGDILKLKYTVASAAGTCYAIVTSIGQTDASTLVISLEKWKSSRFITDGVDISDGAIITRMYAYDGMFSNIMSISDDVNSRFTVTESNSVQNDVTELYNYNDVYTS